jgi:hypothetical protein
MSELAPAIQNTMQICRQDLSRLMDCTDFCATCPLFLHCVADEHPECAKEARDAQD